MKGIYIFSLFFCIIIIILLTLWFLGYFEKKDSSTLSSTPESTSGNDGSLGSGSGGGGSGGGGSGGGGSGGGGSGSGTISSTIDPSMCVSKPNYATYCKKLIKSPNKQCSLNLEDTGNLVIYNEINDKVWATNTANIGFWPFRTILELNGNFVLYDSSFNGKNGEILWQTKTENQGTPPYFVKLLDNCNLLLEDSRGSELWRGIRNRVVKIKGKVSDKCIYSNLDASNNFGQKDCSGNSIMFITEYNANNNFNIINKLTNKCLYSNATEIGHKICAKGVDEFFIIDNERIKNTQTNKCLVSDANRLSQADCNTNENQKFILDNI